MYKGFEEISKAAGISVSKLQKLIRNKSLVLEKQKQEGGRGLHPYVASEEDIEKIISLTKKSSSAEWKSARITKDEEKISLSLSEKKRKGGKKITWKEDISSLEESFSKVRDFFSENFEVFYPDEGELIQEMRERKEEMRLLKGVRE